MPAGWHQGDEILIWRCGEVGTLTHPNSRRRSTALRWFSHMSMFPGDYFRERRADIAPRSMITTTSGWSQRKNDRKQTAHLEGFELPTPSSEDWS
jgi:hypothetical protein